MSSPYKKKRSKSKGHSNPPQEGASLSLQEFAQPPPQLQHEVPTKHIKRKKKGANKKMKKSDLTSELHQHQPVKLASSSVNESTLIPASTTIDNDSTKTQSLLRSRTSTKEPKPLITTSNVPYKLAKDNGEDPAHLARRQHAAQRKIAKIKAELRETQLVPINDKVASTILSCLATNFLQVSQVSSSNYATPASSIPSGVFSNSSNSIVKFKQMKFFQLEKEKERQLNMLNAIQKLADSLLSNIYTLNPKKNLGLLEDNKEKQQQSMSKSTPFTSQCEAIQQEIATKQAELKQFRAQMKNMVLQPMSTAMNWNTISQMSIQNIRDAQASELKLKRHDLQLEQSKLRVLQSRMNEFESAEEKLAEKCDKQIKMIELQESRLARFGDSAKIIANADKIREQKECIKRLAIDLQSQAAGLDKLLSKHAKRKAIQMKQIEDVTRTIDAFEKPSGNGNTESFVSIFAELAAEPFAASALHKEKINKIIANVPAGQTFDYIPAHLLPSEIFECQVTATAPPFVNVPLTSASVPTILTATAMATTMATSTTTTATTIPIVISSMQPQQQQDSTSNQENTPSIMNSKNIRDMQDNQTDPATESMSVQSQSPSPPLLRRSESSSPSPKKLIIKVKPTDEIIRIRQSFSEHISTVVMPSSIPCSTNPVLNIPPVAPPQTPVQSENQKSSSLAGVLSSSKRILHSNSATQTLTKKTTFLPTIGGTHRIIVAGEAMRAQQSNQRNTRAAPGDQINEGGQQRNRMHLFARMSEDLRQFSTFTNQFLNKKPIQQQQIQPQQQQQQQQNQLQIPATFTSAQLLPIEDDQFIPSPSASETTLLPFDDENILSSQAVRKNQSHLIRRRSRYLGSSSSSNVAGQTIEPDSQTTAKEALQNRLKNEAAWTLRVPSRVSAITMHSSATSSQSTARVVVSSSHQDSSPTDDTNNTETITRSMSSFQSKTQLQQSRQSSNEKKDQQQQQQFAQVLVYPVNANTQPIVKESFRRMQQWSLPSQSQSLLTELKKTINMAAAAAATESNNGEVLPISCPKQPIQ